MTSGLAKMSDDDLRRLGTDGLIQRLRDTDDDRIQALRDNTSLMKEINHKMQVHLMEIRSLKEVNQRLQADNQELRDLCCFLDDDRQKGRKLAREWQRFGRYTSGVMQSEVTVYQEKLQELELQQQQLMQENLQLKELCLLLDQERIEREDCEADRERGDGSSNSTASPTAERQDAEQRRDHNNRPYNTLSESTLRYIRHLEEKLEQLEKDQNLQPHLISQAVVNPACVTPANTLPSNPAREGGDHQTQDPPSQRYFTTPRITSTGVNPVCVTPAMREDTKDAAKRRFFTTPRLPPDRQPTRPIYASTQLSGAAKVSPTPPSKPEAVVQAMKVLEIHEQLDRPPDNAGGAGSDNTGDGQMTESEKAIVREMCNVVWKKLEDGSSATK